MKPRYEPTWEDTDDEEDYGNEVLIGHVGLLDVYYEDNFKNNGKEWLLIVGPPERKLLVGPTNFDVYIIEDRCRLAPYEDAPMDLHIELAEMCEIYALAVRLGYMEEQ